MLKQVNCIKSALVSAGLTLQADVGESFLVKAIYAGRVTNDEYLTVKIDNYTVGYWRLKGKRGNHLGGVRLAYTAINLMRLLNERGLKFTYPVSEGQKLTLSAHTGIGTFHVIYDRYSAGDITASMPNGTQSKIFSFIQYLKESSVLTASGDMSLDTALTPAEFPDFPAGKAVPAKMKIRLHGIEGSPVADFVSGNNGFYTTYLKMIREREVLLDEDRLGIPFLGSSAATGTADYDNTESVIGSCGEGAGTAMDYEKSKPYWFDPPLEFASGEELNIILSWLLVGARTMAANLPDVNLILETIRE